MPLDALYDSIEKASITVDDYVKKLKTEREKILKWVFDQKKIIADKNVH